MVLIRRIAGSSMLPSLKPGNIVVGMRRKRLKVGDIVIARWLGREIIKRVDQHNNDHVYLLGDNAAHSTDSRQYGWLPTSAVVAVVLGVNNRA